MPQVAPNRNREYAAPSSATQWLLSPRAWLAWARTSGSAPAWTLGVGVVAAVMALPLATIVYLAFSPAAGVWPHLMRTVLPGALADTLLVLAGVSALTLVFGTGTAWLITMYRFPGRALIDRLLVLPLAIPTYIAAYCYVELLDFSGPLQSALRAVFGWHTVKDYWFPDVRSLSGAIIVLSAVLYPYVYLSARASFVQQSICVLEVARTLGQTPAGAFWRVALPLARPALAAGLALALMECMNDLGAVQYLGVQTLTVSIYATWLQRSSLGGAAQIALVALLFVLALMLAERWGRGRGQYHHTTGRYRSIPFSDLEGWRAFAATGFCALPFAAGFVLPFSVLSAAGRRSCLRCPGRRLLAGGCEQHRRCRRGCDRHRGARPDARLRPPRRAKPVRARRRAGRRPRLRAAWHGAGAWPAHSARRVRQRPRRDAAALARGFHWPAAFGQPVRGDPGLRDPLPCRIAIGPRGWLCAGFAQSRCRGPRAGRDGVYRFVAGAHAAAGARARCRGPAGVRGRDEGAARHLAVAALQFRDARHPRLCLRGAGAIRERDVGRPYHRAHRTAAGAVAAPGSGGGQGGRRLGRAAAPADRRVRRFCAGFLLRPR